MPDAAELEAAIDALYQGPLDAFTASRNALAAERRRAGDRDGAERVKALVKPSATAWAVNQVWWNHRRALERLLDAGERQRAAHRAFAEGRASDVRAASLERQQAVDGVVELAMGAMGGAGAVTPDVRHRLAGTVEALASGGMPAGIAPGRLARELRPSGLEAFGALGLAAIAAEAGPRSRPTLVKTAAPAPAAGTSAEHARPEGAKARARAAEEARRDARDREAREKKLEEAHTRLESVEAALEAAAREAVERSADEEKARAAVDAAAAQVAGLEAALERARDEDRASRRALSAAMKAASEAEMMRARTARDVAAARAALEALQQRG
ncbi:MAG: hypothetical protein AB7Q16_00875 [Vicinamibacterales bacterium]